MCAGPEIAAAVEAITAATAAAAETTPVAEAAIGGIDAMQAAGLGGMGVAQQGIGSGALSSQLAGAMNNPASLMSSQGLLANTAKGVTDGLLGGGGQGTQGLMAAKMGLDMMNPPQQQRPGPQPPMPQGQPAPMPLPYSRPPMGQMPQMPRMGMSEEEKQRLRAMGMRV